MSRWHRYSGDAEEADLSSGVHRGCSDESWKSSWEQNATEEGAEAEGEGAADGSDILSDSRSKGAPWPSSTFPSTEYRSLTSASTVSDRFFDRGEAASSWKLDGVASEERVRDLVRRVMSLFCW
jgi:hypothetical protein